MVTTGMTNLLPIQNVQHSDVLEAVRRALRTGLDADVIADFLASVDWSGADRQRPAIADLLGELEAWTDQFDEGGLTISQFVGHLLGTLPVDERRDRFVLGGGPVMIKVSLIKQTAPLVLVQGQPEMPPQTGSGAPPLAIDVFQRDIARVL